MADHSPKIRLTRAGAAVLGALAGSFVTTIIITYTLFASQWGA